MGKRIFPDSGVYLLGHRGKIISDCLKLLAVEIICALAAVRCVVSSSESVAGSKEVILHSTLKQETEHTGQKAHHGSMQKVPSARRNPLIFWQRGG